jgi:DGQHR domain-containing protein
MIEFDYIEVKQPIGTFYLCSIPASVLLRILDVKRHSQQLEGVQRDLSNERVKKIGEYCSDPDAIFPTPIVASINATANVIVDETKHKIAIANTETVIGDVIDGQHRLWGIKQSSNIESFVLPVVFMFGLTIEQKAYIFSTINSNQVKVSQSLIYDLFDVSKARSPYKTVHQIARAMNSSESSPFYNRLKMLGKKESRQEFAILSQGTFAKSILQLISRNPDDDARRIKREEVLQPDYRCPFRDYFIDERDDVITKILFNCFSALKSVFPKEWEDPRTNILWKTTGFRAIIYALPSLIRKGKREKVLTKEFFELCFSAFKQLLEEKKITVTSKDFPSGGEQNQKKLAGLILDAVSNLNIDTYIANLIRPASFEDFLKSIGELDYHEIYDLAQALQGHTETLTFFKYKEKDSGDIEITYPYYDSSIGLTKEGALDSLHYLETKYMEGIDADTWYGYKQALEKELNKDD